MHVISIVYSHKFVCYQTSTSLFENFCSLQVLGEMSSPRKRCNECIHAMEDNSVDKISQHIVIM